MALIEFYNGDARHPFDSVKDGAVPREGEYISIRKETWRVRRVAWAIDRQLDAAPGELRADVELEKGLSE